MRTKPISFPEIALFHRCLAVVHLAATGLSGFLLGTPRGKRRRGIAVNLALTYDGDILQPITIDERAVVLQESSFPTGLHQRQIAGRSRRKLQCGPFLQLQTNIAYKMNWPFQPILSCRNDYTCSSQPGCTLHGLVEGRLTVFHPITFCSKRSDTYLCLGNGSSCDLFQDGIALGDASSTISRKHSSWQKEGCEHEK